MLYGQGGELYLLSLLPIQYVHDYISGDKMNHRGSGLLLHITSLPSRFGIGDFGPQAYAFADKCIEARQQYWQILPLTPTDPFYDHSPYHSISAFAFNPLMISPELLVRDGLLDGDDVADVEIYLEETIDFDRVKPYKDALFEKAFSRFRKKEKPSDYEMFCRENAYWLDTYALFCGLKNHFGPEAWSEWPAEVRDVNRDSIDALLPEISETMEYTRFLQYCAATQWMNLKRYCNERGLYIIGDIPIYVDYDSADVWSNQEYFKLDENKRPYVVAGVPPDYFSETGQLWGNPIYNWDVMRQRDFDWWMMRVRHNLTFFDIVRIDHFRGLVAYWEVPAGEETAMNGRWVHVPVYELFSRLMRIKPYLPVIAEDLGLITPDVREVIRDFKLPGMKVLLFAFGDDLRTNPYIPHNVREDCVYYVGTHDNNTARGWYESEADDYLRDRVRTYMGRDLHSEEIPWEMMRMVMMSRANTAIFQVQDVLSLGAEHRTNIPSTSTGNWRWRLGEDALTNWHIERLRHMTEMYARV